MILDSIPITISRRFIAASSHYLVGSTMVTNPPLLLASWCRFESVGVFQNSISVGVTGSNNNRYTLGITAGGAVQAVTRTTSSSSATAGTVTVNTWQHIAGYYGSATSRFAYLNGVAGSEDTTSRAPTGLDQIDIGRQANGGGSMDGKLAEVCIYAPASQTIADIIVSRLAAREAPYNVFPHMLLAFWDWVGTEMEISNTTGTVSTLTNSGSSPSPGPFFSRRVNRRNWLRGAGYLAAGGGFKAAWARQRSGFIGSGTR
jgi:hypothetical protein